MTPDMRARMSYFRCLAFAPWRHLLGQDAPPSAAGRARLRLWASKGTWKTLCFHLSHAMHLRNATAGAELQLPERYHGQPCAGNRSSLRLRLPSPLPIAVKALLYHAAFTARGRRKPNRQGRTGTPQLVGATVARTVRRQVSGCQPRAEPIPSL